VRAVHHKTVMTIFHLNLCFVINLAQQNVSHSPKYHEFVLQPVHAARFLIKFGCKRSTGILLSWH